MKQESNTAIVLAAGQGKRMNTKVHKQYLLIEDRPVLYYSLRAMEDSFIDDIVLVVGKGEEEYCRREILEKYHFTKVHAVIALGLHAISWECDYVFIHDGARPFINEEILRRAYECVMQCKACIVGMPVKDTVKISDRNGYVESTPPRNRVWQVQTPQVFETALIIQAYDELIDREEELLEQHVTITDDAMVVEQETGAKVALAEGSYQNIKITTPEDLDIAEAFLKH